MNSYPKKNGLGMSPKRLELLEFLLMVRGATKHHLATGLYGLNLEERELQKKLSALSLRLRDLQKAHLIKRFLPPLPNHHKNPEKVYYLTEEGFDYLLKEWKGIKAKIGTGFNGDLGVFNYELHQPPQKHTLHLLLQTEVHIVMHELRKKFEGRVDYRDNLHAAVTFNLVEPQKGRVSKQVFRPDGEFYITIESEENGEHMFRKLRFLIEVDTGSERGAHLQKKAQQYEEYFDHLNDQGLPLPDGVFFITQTRSATETGYNIKQEERFQSLYRAFKGLTEDSDGKSIFAIHCLEIQELYSRLNTMLLNYDEQMELAESATSFLTASLPANIRSGVDLGCDFSFVQSEMNGERITFVFAHLEGGQTEAWIKAVNYYDYFLNRFGNSDHERRKSRVEIIFYFEDAFSIIPISSQELKQTANIALISEHIHFLDLRDGAGNWYNSERTMLEGCPFGVLTTTS